MDLERPRVLSLLGCYWPGNEATGPNQSFRAMAFGLKDAFDIRVVSRSHTKTVGVDWRRYGDVNLRQLQIGTFGAKGLRQLLQETPHDLLLLNGFQDREFTIPALVMRKLGLIDRKPTILSPRGEFADGARSIKSSRKKAYLAAVKVCDLLRDVWLHSTADHERNDINKMDLCCRGVLEAPNPRLLADLPYGHLQSREISEPLKLVFLGRVTPVKNVTFALEVLRNLNIPVEFHIFGPIADPVYWSVCESIIANLPSHVRVRRMGELPHTEVVTRLARYDLFFLPTLGENFGHAIAEALSAGLPVLIADTTSWRDLKKAGAGWDLPLDDQKRYVQAIMAFKAKSPSERTKMRTAARRLAEHSFSESNAVAANKEMLFQALRNSEA